jgi:hypothetical protein
MFTPFRKHYKKIQSFLISFSGTIVKILKNAFNFIKKHAIYFEVLILFLAVLFGIFIILSYGDNYDFYKSQVSQFIVPQITVDGKTYKVENGEIYINGNRLNSNIGNFFLRLKVLRLSFFAIQARIDPLFGIEGQDLDKLSHSIDLLQNSTDGFSNFVGTNDEKFVNENIHPIDFLRKIRSTEAMRREIVSNPSEKKIDEYNEKLISTINGYETGILRLKKIFSIAIDYRPDYKNISIDFIGGTSKFSSYINFLSAMEANAKVKRNEYRARVECLSGNWKKCEALKKVFSIIESSGKISVSQSDSNDKISIKSEYRTQLDILKNFFDNNKDKFRFESQPIFGVSTDCFGEKDKSYFSFSWLNFEGEDIFKPRLINSLYFIDITRNLVPIFDPLRKRGDQYAWQQETNYYLCPDLTYLGQLNSLYEVRKLLENNRISNSNYRDPEIDKFMSIERNLLEDSISDTDFQKFISYGLELLNKYSETGLANKMGVDKVLYFEKVFNIYKENSAGLSDLISGGWQQNEGLKRSASNASSKQEFKDNLPYYVLRRSAPSIYFLAFNRSINEKIPPIMTISPAPSKEYLDLESIRPLTNQEIVKIMTDSVHLSSMNKELSN